MLVRWFPQRAAVGYSRWTDRSVHLCSNVTHPTYKALAELGKVEKTIYL